MTVMTVAPGCFASSCPALSTASSKCGETTASLLSVSSSMTRTQSVSAPMSRHYARVTKNSHDGGVIDIDEEAFGQLVEEALDSIPPELGKLMRNVAIVVEDYGGAPNFLGLFHGGPPPQSTPTADGGGCPRP